MIPRDYITEWRAQAPWVQDFQIEQDLVVCRALVAIFSRPLLKDALALRGGTALYKLHLKPAARYSEDIDLVQVEPEQAGPMLDALHGVLGPWLGEPRRKRNENGLTLLYRFSSDDAPPIPLRLKVEINSREHFAHQGFRHVPFAVSSRWFEGSCQIMSYELDELLGTKLRALYQRRKGRDLFDLATALKLQAANPARIIEAFSAYMSHGGHRVTRAQFEENLAAKLNHRQFAADIGPLLAAGHAWDMPRAAADVSEQLIALLPGERWKSES